MTIGAKAHGEHANMGVVSLKTRGAGSSPAGSGLPGAKRNVNVVNALGRTTETPL